MTKKKKDDWHLRNPERHYQRTKSWRENNRDRSRELGRKSQKTRRSTEWGKINNRIWPIMMNGLKNIKSEGSGKYCTAIGYSWGELRRHLESKFDENMSWENHGSYWHIDHINPISSFKYTSLDDNLFKEAWSLSNIRPLEKVANMKKWARNNGG